MTKPGNKVRGSDTGRPIMVLLDQLGQRWTLRILWELRDGPMTFRELQSRCENVSPTLLNKRLKELREMKLVIRNEGGYDFTKFGQDLGEQLLALSRWSNKWAKSLD